MMIKFSVFSYKVKTFFQRQQLRFHVVSTPSHVGYKKLSPFSYKP